jgi:prepilin-type N-terminal cleavage/methylation domain-containing protein
MKTSQRGFTLVELMIGLVLLGIVTTTIYRVLTVNQRLARAQTEQVSLQSAVRTGSLVVATELKEIGINSLGASDIVAMNTNGITYRAMRSTGIACQVSATEVRIRRDRFYSTRNIVAGQDGLLLWVEADPDLLSDDSWLLLPIANVSNGACGGVPAIVLTTVINTAVTPLSSILIEAPVRTFEVMELGITNVGGQNWLGARSVSGGGVMQPALGPITANGLEFQYRDASNNLTANPAAVQSIGIMIRGETDRMVRAGGEGPLQLAQDSLSMRITLRNAPHP